MYYSVTFFYLFVLHDKGKMKTCKISTDICIITLLFALFLIVYTFGKIDTR